MTLIYIHLSNLYITRSGPSSNVSFDSLRSEVPPQFHVMPRFRYISDIS